MAFVDVHAAAAAAPDRFRSLVVLRAVSLHREREEELIDQTERGSDTFIPFFFREAIC